MKQLNQAQTLAVHGAICDNEWMPVGIPGIVVGACIGALPPRVALGIVLVTVSSGVFLIGALPPQCAYSVANFILPMSTTTIGVGMSKLMFSRG